MTTNATHSVPLPPASPASQSRWIPRSLEATSLMLLTAVSFAWPFFLAAFWSYVYATGCFFDCTEPSPGAAVGLGALAALILTIPVAAVRLFQSLGPGSLRYRVIAILLLDVAALAFTVYWLRPS